MRLAAAPGSCAYSPRLHDPCSALFAAEKRRKPASSSVQGTRGPGFPGLGQQILTGADPISNCRMKRCRRP